MDIKYICRRFIRKAFSPGLRKNTFLVKVWITMIFTVCAPAVWFFYPNIRHFIFDIDHRHGPNSLKYVCPGALELPSSATTKANSSQDDKRNIVTTGSNKQNTRKPAGLVKTKVKNHRPSCPETPPSLRMLTHWLLGDVVVILKM